MLCSSRCRGYDWREIEHREEAMRRFAFLAVFSSAAILSVSTGARAGERPIVAVFDMEDRGAGIDREVLANLTDYLASLLAEGGYQVIPRDQIRDRLMGEQKESYKVCYDQACQIELGRELAAQKVLATQILKIGKSCQVTSNLYDLKRTATELAANASSSCDVDSLLGAVRTVAAKLCGQLTGKIYEETRREEEKQQAEREAARQAADEAATRAREAKARAQARAQAEAERRAQERRKQEQAAAELRRIKDQEEAQRKKLSDRRKARIRPLVLEDMRGMLKIGAVKIDFPFVYLPAGDYQGIGMLFSFDVGEGNAAGDMFSFGAELPLSVYSPDEGETAERFGNIAVTFKYLKCTGGDWSFCFGTSTAIGLSMLEDLAGPDKPDELAAQLVAERVGRAAFQDPSRFIADQFTLRPLGVVTLAGQDFFAQLQLGGLLYAPVQNMENWEALGLSLMYGLSAGYQVVDWFVPLVEFNGNSPLAGKPVPMVFSDEDTALFVNLGFVFDFDDFCMILRLTLPLTEDARLDNDVHLGLVLSGNV
jgi:hypothetical protein